MTNKNTPGIFTSARGRYNGRMVSLQRGTTGSVMTSSNGGLTWVVNTSGIAIAGWYWMVYDQKYGRLVAIANGSNYAGYSNDGGITWVTSSSALKGGTTFYKLVYDPVHERLITCARDSLVCNYSADGGSTWVQTSMSPVVQDGWFIFIWDPDHSRVISVPLSTTTTTCYTADGGSTWVQGGALTGSLYGLAYYGGAFDPIHRKIVIIAYGIASGASGSVVTAYSTDGGTTWSRGGDLPVFAIWGALAYDPIHGRLIAIADYSNITAYSEDGGVTWIQGGTIVTNNPSVLWRELIYDHVHGTMVIPANTTAATYAPQFARTADGGVTWSVVSAGTTASMAGTCLGIIPI